MTSAVPAVRTDGPPVSPGARLELDAFLANWFKAHAPRDANGNPVARRAVVEVKLGPYGYMIVSLDFPRDAQ